MTAFTFFFNKETFDQRRHMASPGTGDVIDYVTGEDKRPLNTLVDGDELFVLGILNGQVRIAGRLVVDGAPVSRVEAEMRLGRKQLREGEIYLLGKVGLLDPFRANQTLDADVAKGLVLFTSTGQPANVAGLRAGSPDPNQFRVPLRLSDASADALRRALGLKAPAAAPTDHDDADASKAGDGLDKPPPGHDDDEYRLQSIKTRRGQSKFRDRLMDAYRRQCVITRCGVEGLLEAAHITPHAEHTDYNVSNGLLLRSDIHTLFDLNLIGIDTHYRVRVSAKLRYSEYWIYNDRQLERFPERLADNPSREALERRISKLEAD
jgi:hypothetical protein